MLQQLKSGFKRTINWNRYYQKPELLRQDPNLNHLVEPSFKGVNRLFVLAFENDAQRTSHSGCYLPNIELKDCNVMINRENIFDQPVKDNKVHMKTLEKLLLVKGMITKQAILLDYPYFKR